METLINPLFQQPVSSVSKSDSAMSAVKALEALDSLFPDSDPSLATTSSVSADTVRVSSEKTEKLLKCRFAACPSGQSAATPREMKLHYAGRHFSHLFTVDPETRLPPGFTRSGSRAVCCKCTELCGKPVYVQGDEHIVRGHLVVKHDSLGEVLLQATESPEAGAVISDLYPELLEWTACP